MEILAFGFFGIIITLLLLVILWKVLFSNKGKIIVSESAVGHSYYRDYHQLEHSHSQEENFSQHHSSTIFDPTDMLNPLNPLSPLWVGDFLQSNEDLNDQTNYQPDDVQLEPDLEYGGGRFGGAGAGGEFDVNDQYSNDSYSNDYSSNDDCGSSDCGSSYCGSCGSDD